MKKNTKLATCLFIVIGLLTSCGHFDEINTNPDVPTRVTPEMLALGGIYNMLSCSTGKTFLRCNIACKHIAWGELADDYLYNGWGRAGLANYHTMINMRKMVELADEKDVNAYSGLEKFVEAYTLFWSSMELGDIPCSDALKGEEGNIKPKYDTQKEVMCRVLDDLESAYDYFSAGVDFREIRLWEVV